MRKYILGSTSPRRKELLKKVGINFEVKPPSYEEHMENKVFTYELIKSLAENKCESVCNQINESAIVISADTVVVYEDKVLGKPQNFEDAYKMLKLLSGKTHKVVTAVCVTDTDTNKKIINTETSEVTFNKLQDDMIIKYINEYKPYDKAGSYGIQELPEGFVNNIKGEYDNIVGLSVNLLLKMLSELR